MIPLVRRPNLDAIRRRVAAATPGTWKTGDQFANGALGPSVAVLAGNLPPVELDSRRNGRADAAFIAHARQDVPALLAEIDQLRALADQLGERLANHAYCENGHTPPSRDSECPFCRDIAAVEAWRKLSGRTRH